MVISTNIEPHKAEFENLLAQMVLELKNASSLNSDRFLRHSSSDLEKTTKEVLDSCAKGTPFENTIELIGGQHFPDIIACNYYGVEVKTVRSNHWKSVGSSVAEGTRVKGIERIFMLFGKIYDPIDFMCKPYETCLSDVVVTHSPRYLIDMNLNEGETFFDKIAIPYDELRKKENPIKTILDYYKENLKPGQTTWWADTGCSKQTNMVVRLWNSINLQERHKIKTKALCLFPEILSNTQTKYNRMNLWLVTIEGVVVPNVRDMFTAGGRTYIEFAGKNHEVPKIIYTLCANLPYIIETLKEYGNDELSEYWGFKIKTSNVFDLWANLIGENAETITGFPLEEFILSKTWQLG